MNRLWVLLALAGAPAALPAQGPPPPPPGRPGPDSAQVERLRGEIERRFAERVQAELGLTADQATRLKATQERYGARRRDLMRSQWLHREGLQRQMRPGVAADPDSVRVHMDALRAGRADAVKLDEEEDREMAAYLTPVQRARFQFMRQRLMDRVNDMRRERELRGGRGPGPRMRPGQRPPGPGRGPRRR